MKTSSVVVGLLMMMLLPLSAAMASNASPYVIAEWGLNDKFQDGTTPVTIADTSVTFVNPTECTQVLEYAFFDDDGNFCGCDRDFPGPNAITRYTMSAESAGGMFQCNKIHNNVKTHGAVKSIVFQSDPNNTTITVGSAMTLGFQTHFFPGGRTEADQVSINISATNIPAEMTKIHQACVNFCNSPNNAGICPPNPTPLTFCP